MALFIKQDGSREFVYLQDKSNGFTLDELYDLIGCQLIETYTLENGPIFIFDEEGRFNPYNCINLKASWLANIQLVGNVVVIFNPEEFQ